MGCPALELAGRWVELGLSIEMEISGRALADWYYEGPGGLWWTNVLNSALPPQWLRPDTWPEHQDSVSHTAGSSWSRWTEGRRNVEDRRPVRRLVWWNQAKDGDILYLGCTCKVEKGASGSQSAHFRLFALTDLECWTSQESALGRCQIGAPGSAPEAHFAASKPLASWMASWARHCSTHHTCFEARTWHYGNRVFLKGRCLSIWIQILTWLFSMALFQKL